MQIMCADELINLIRKNELQLVFSKIAEAAKNFRRVAYVSCDFKLKVDTINHLTEIGYKIDTAVHTKTAPYMYTYEIKW